MHIQLLNDVCPGLVSKHSPISPFFVMGSIILQFPSCICALLSKSHQFDTSQKKDCYASLILQALKLKDVNSILDIPFA